MVYYYYTKYWQVSIMESLKRLRLKNRLTQVDVARAINCPRPIYVLLEQGRLDPQPEQLAAFSKLYNVSVSYLTK